MKRITTKKLSTKKNFILITFIFFFFQFFYFINCDLYSNIYIDDSSIEWTLFRSTTSDKSIGEWKILPSLLNNSTNDINLQTTNLTIILNFCTYCPKISLSWSNDIVNETNIDDILNTTSQNNIITIFNSGNIYKPQITKLSFIFNPLIYDYYVIVTSYYSGCSFNLSIINEITNRPPGKNNTFIIFFKIF